MFCRCTHPREFHTRIADLEAEVERLRSSVDYWRDSAGYYRRKAGLPSGPTPEEAFEANP